MAPKPTSSTIHSQDCRVPLMSTRFLIPLCGVAVLLAACGNRDDDAKTRGHSPDNPPANPMGNTDTATTPGAMGDTATTPGGNAGDTEPGATPSDTPPTPPPPSGS